MVVLTVDLRVILGAQAGPNMPAHLREVSVSEMGNWQWLLLLFGIVFTWFCVWSALERVLGRRIG